MWRGLHWRLRQYYGKTDTSEVKGSESLTCDDNFSAAPHEYCSERNGFQLVFLS